MRLRNSHCHRHRHQSGPISYGVLTLAGGIAGLVLTGCASSAHHRVEFEQHRNTVQARLKYQLARQQFEKGDSAAAVDIVNEAIATDALSLDQYLLLAQCRLEQGKLVSARDAAQQALRCDPEAAEAEYTLGVVAERMEQFDTALAHYRRARSHGANAVDYVVAEAECLVAMDTVQEAIELVSTNIGLLDSDGTLELLLARLFILVRDQGAALQYFGMAVKRSECRSVRSKHSHRCDTLIGDYGGLLSATGRHLEAIDLLEPYLEGRSDPLSSVVAALSASYLATGQLADASRLLRAQTSRFPDMTSCWMLLARTSILQEDWITARHCADQLLRLAPNSEQTHLVRAFVCWKQHDLQLAAALLEKALVINSEDALGHCLLGRVLEEMDGSQQLAQTHYKRVHQIDPQYVCARRVP